VPNLEPLAEWPINRGPWKVHHITVVLLQPVAQHRAIDRRENLGPDLQDCGTR
jgi:hypothetical protein